MMFEKLFDFIATVGEWIAPFAIVPVAEGGVIVHYTPWKVYIKTVGPGLYFKVPLISQATTVSTAVNTMQIGPLSIEGWVVVGVLEYYVKDPRPLCIEVADELAALRNTTCAALRQRLTDGSNPITLERDVRNDVATRRANRWGFKLVSFDIITLTKMTSYRHLIDYGAGGGEHIE